MEALETIMTRRSVRDFRSDLVSEADVEKLLKAGMQAPSANNERPWHFVVIDDPEVLHKIPEFHRNAQMLKYAPMAILVCSDRKLESKRAYWIQDCSAATENILLAAHGMGLGAVWLGVFPNADRVKGLQSLLKLPAGIRPVTLIAVGHPALTPEPTDRFDQGRIHKNRW
ncbi:MAG: nitroreductase family protein [Anaerolineaceae bacterium]|nr:nitroreductase family protein [Anaerolineaceae bacterium]